MTLAAALDRTLLLMRDEVGQGPADDVLLDALTTTTVALVADARTLACHAAQSAFVTTALLMARSAHRVFLVAPNLDLVGPQPPLATDKIISGLVELGRNLLPGVEFSVRAPATGVDLVVAFGDTPTELPGLRRIRVNADPWAGAIEPWESAAPWEASWWPLGGLAAGALAAAEAFKCAMLKLLPHALNPAMTAAVFAPTDRVRMELAPAGTPYARDLGQVDFISGGAINSSALYVIGRLPSVGLQGRVIEPDSFALSNLNRYPLMRASHDGLAKAETLAGQFARGVGLKPVPHRFPSPEIEGPLAPAVVVGVDDIPTRWAVQRMWPNWLVVGATTHWSAMASVHEPGQACAQCLHPEDEPGNAPIPTQACVSFWAGLLVVAYLARHAAGGAIPVAQQQVFTTVFRPETAVWGGVGFRPACPTCQGVQRGSVSDAA
jgi:hypothetical protein